MASIFTYDPDPPRVASPWFQARGGDLPCSFQTKLPRDEHISDYGVTKLEAEPQDGPTEYKLHLLLRPRRQYSTFTTNTKASTHLQGEYGPPLPVSTRTREIPVPTTHSRQRRLEQLTTQLLWRLQQSSPHHATSASTLVQPRLPEAADNVDAPGTPGRLVAGLEESRGALYEIGVSDDGTLVGLTEDELEESLTNLRAMATSLGCTVEITRRVLVGHCSWQEQEAQSDELAPSAEQSRKIASDTSSLRRNAQLWVAEALIIPVFDPMRHGTADTASHKHTNLQPPLRPYAPDKTIASSRPDQKGPEQLRLTLTGPTTSGKSSLLGVLSTSTLDNGRGKSRLSLLKHRHEIATGVTSSVTQELFGYTAHEVVNHSSNQIESWTDIHAIAIKRLVLVTDSAGHPRYFRTAARGLIGWAPHWTLLCIVADNGQDNNISPADAVLAQSSQGSLESFHLAASHLELCLKLNSPLVIVITKLDVASKATLRLTLSRLLSVIKATGRKPVLLPPENAKNIDTTDLCRTLDDTVTSSFLPEMLLNPEEVIPIVLTSALTGVGIGQLHSLLSQLPLPPRPTAHDLTGLALNPEQPAALFHVEDVYDIPAGYQSPLEHNASSRLGNVVAGHCRFGSFSIGDRILIGPFPAPGIDTGDALETCSASLGTEAASSKSPNLVAASITKGEWYDARIISIRNLRRPVQMLEAGHVGTLGLVCQHTAADKGIVPRIRKGMVVAVPSRHMVQTGHTLQAASGFTASFDDGDISSVTKGSLVVVYVASVRASAKVVRLAPRKLATQFEANRNSNGSDSECCSETTCQSVQHDQPSVFGIDGIIDVTFELMTNREWLELGSQVLCMPGGGQGLYSGSERGEKGVAGLQGFVGKVIEVVE